MRAKCEHCDSLLVAPSGPLGADVLLVGEYPGKEEIIKGRAFVGRTGEVLTKELARVGIGFGGVRATNLWLHNTKKDEFDWHMAQLIREMERAKYVLLMGSECAEAFSLGGVSDLVGLEVESPLFPKDIVVMVTNNPAIVFHKTVGEFRLSLEKFAERIRL